MVKCTLLEQEGSDTSQQEEGRVLTPLESFGRIFQKIREYGLIPNDKHLIAAEFDGGYALTAIRVVNDIPFFDFNPISILKSSPLRSLFYLLDWVVEFLAVNIGKKVSDLEAENARLSRQVDSLIKEAKMYTQANEKLGAELEVARQNLAHEKGRADAFERQVKSISDSVASLGGSTLKITFDEERDADVWKDKFTKLRIAAYALYYSAKWFADRPVVNSEKLWAELRDAAEFQAGWSPQSNVTAAVFTLNLDGRYVYYYPMREGNQYQDAVFSGVYHATAEDAAAYGAKRTSETRTARG